MSIAQRAPYVHEYAVAHYDYHYGYLFAKNIWENTEAPDSENPVEGKLVLPDLDETFALIDTVMYGPEVGLQSLLLGMGGCTNKKCHVQNEQIDGFNRGLNATSTPNVNYYLFRESSTKAPVSDPVKAAFDEALALYEKLFNNSKTCYLNGWTEKRGYKTAGIIYQPGLRYRHYFKCPSEFSDKELGVHVGAILINDGGEEVFAYVNTKCEVPIYDKKAKRVSDLSICGFDRAEQHQELLGDDTDWIQVAVGPSEDDYASMEMRTHFRGSSRIDVSPSPLKDKLVRKIRASLTEESED